MLSYDGFNGMENSKKVADKAYQEYLDVQKANRTNQAFQSAASGADYTGAFLPKAAQFFKTFNNKYGTEGQKIASTRFSIPSMEVNTMQDPNQYLHVVGWAFLND